MLKCERVASARGGVRRQAGDNGTREMIDKILLDEERHIDWAETQRELLAQLGLPNYLQSQS
jgi:bacterioferritin